MKSRLSGGTTVHLKPTYSKRVMFNYVWNIPVPLCSISKFRKKEIYHQLHVIYVADGILHTKILTHNCNFTTSLLYHQAREKEKIWLGGHNTHAMRVWTSGSPYWRPVMDGRFFCIGTWSDESLHVQNSPGKKGIPKQRGNGQKSDTQKNNSEAEKCLPLGDFQIRSEQNFREETPKSEVTLL